MAKRSGVSIRTTNYKTFRGVDFSTDPSQVDRTRSPYAVNMISDEGGKPEKRPGYMEVEHTNYQINGMFRPEFSGAKHFLIHAGNYLYKWTVSGGISSLTTLATDLPSARSTGVFLNGKLYIFTGSGLFVYDGTNTYKAETNAYVPLTVIGRQAGETPGGEPYEGINYLSDYQRASFLAVEDEPLYKLPYETVDSVVSVTVDGEDESPDNYDVDLTAGTVTFHEGHIPSPPAAGAADNVEIKFKKVLDGYKDRINHCSTAIVWGADGKKDRIVASGDPYHRNIDYISGYMDGEYWSDKEYQSVGSETTSIIGYRRLGDSLAVIKEDNGQDSSVYVRMGSVQDDGEVDWQTYPCLSGIGAVSRYGFGNISDDQLVVTGNGIYGLTVNSITAQKVAEPRSMRVNEKLTKEDLKDCICASFRNMFFVFVGTHVYILDGRHAKSYENRNDTVYSYECFYWENFPARSVMVTSDDGVEEMYFGTQDGKIMKVMWDEERMLKYSDGGKQEETWIDGEPIPCVWSTIADDDGDPMILKTVLKKGNAVTLKPFARSSAKVCIRTDRDCVDWQCNWGYMDIFNWEDIDFSRFTFDANDAPREIPFNRKIKNYKRLQIVVRNDGLNEGFGIFGIVKHYVTGNFAKR